MSTVKFLWVFLGLQFLYSCSKKELPEIVFGEWRSELVDITVRVEPRFGQFEFIDGKAEIYLNIKEDFSVDGQIGLASFKNGELVKDWGNSSKNNVDITIKCGQIGAIFDGDPLDQKELEIWMGPVRDTSEAELRYTEGMAYFPMASLELIKQ